MSFDSALIRELAIASDAAYAPSTDLPGKLGGPATPFRSESTDTQGFIKLNGTRALLAFRGTTNTNDWLTNAQIAFADNTHRGNRSALESIWADVTSIIDAARPTEIWVTGHSLGGALAVLAASRLGDRCSGLVTFGQPRVGDSAFANRCQLVFGARYRRFVNDKDVVPRVPLYSGFYRHFGEGRRLGTAEHSFEGRIETIEDAIQLLTGRQVDLPFDDAFEELLGWIETCVAGHQHAEAQSLRERTLRNFAKIFDGEIDRVKKLHTGGGLQAPEIVADHAMPAYITALGR